MTVRWSRAESRAMRSRAIGAAESMRASPVVAPRRALSSPQFARPGPGGASAMGLCTLGRGSAVVVDPDARRQPRRTPAADVASATKSANEIYLVRASQRDITCSPEEVRLARWLLAGPLEVSGPVSIWSTGVRRKGRQNCRT
jgi:hypothetical protein